MDTLIVLLTYLISTIHAVIQSENRSTVDNYKVWTGADDATDLRKVLQWDNRRYVIWWMFFSLSIFYFILIVYFLFIFLNPSG